MINVLTNSGIDETVDDKVKEDYVNAQHIYQSYLTAQKEGEDSAEANQLKQDREKHQGFLTGLMSTN